MKTTLLEIKNLILRYNSDVIFMFQIRLSVFLHRFRKLMIAKPYQQEGNLFFIKPKAVFKLAKEYFRMAKALFIKAKVVSSLMKTHFKLVKDILT